MISIALIISFFFAMNIGASGTAASMGAAYGGGAIRRKWVALLLVAISVFFGAFMGGGEVVKTISQGIIPSGLLSVEMTITIIAAACITLFLSNLMAIPLSTSEVTVGAVVGVGIAYQQVYWGKVLFILAVWILVPFISLGISYLIGKWIEPLERRLQSRESRRWRSVLTLLLIAAGCYEAFSAGMNNVANAVGPLVGAGLIGANAGILWGGLFVSLGAILLGGRVLDTNATKITKLSLLKGSAVSLTSGTLVVIASLFGLPVPLTQMTTMSIFGIGTVSHGSSFWKSDIVKRVVKVWVLSPISSLAVSFIFVQTLKLGDLYGLGLMILVLFSLLGFVFIRRRKKTTQKKAKLKKMTMKNEGQGINFSADQ